MVNVHASGGVRMMEAARNALAGYSQRPLLTAVTVLTSMSEQDLQQVGCSFPPDDQVQRLARLSKDNGLDGVVCSAQEAAALRAALGKDFLLVTPGIRPASADHGDQRRVATPAQAIAAGSNYLVIGRPITGQPDPAAALAAINAELTG
jgi:orotidine-5'-phosphate decarboxylase